ncbi:hypothetical protein EPYR_00270 [Erwinia pyrifoliae DSM 12163]|nr:hypothetical protein EPYR_00270 [Erwinia pyrifoliae DSM 12163]
MFIYGSGLNKDQERINTRLTLFISWLFIGYFNI